MSHLGKIFFILALTAGITLRLYNLTNVSSRSPDEAVYTYQAATIAENGTAGIRKLVRDYNLDKTQWIYPKPIRPGYLWPLAGLMKITNRFDVNVGAYMSGFFSIASLILLIIFGLRFFNRWVALCALFFMSVSPIELAVARRTWQDAMLGFLGFLLIYLAAEIIRARPKKILYIPFAFVGSYAILIKESGAVFYALCIAWVLWAIIVKERSFSEGALFAGISALGAGISVLYTIYISGGISNAVLVMRHFNEALPTNIYAVQYQSGPWHQFPGGFWIISPVNTVLFLIGTVGALSSKKEFRETTLGMLFLITALIAATLLAPLSQNLRYVSMIFGPFYLIGGVGLWHVISYIKARFSRFYFLLTLSYIIAALFIGTIIDYRHFIKIFIRTGIVDTSIRLLRENSH